MSNFSKAQQTINVINQTTYHDEIQAENSSKSTQQVRYTISGSRPHKQCTSTHSFLPHSATH
jgi:hypothetical protein